MKRAAYRAPRPARPNRWRAIGFGLVVVAVLGIGIALASSDLLVRGDTTGGEALPVRMSMAGYTPSEIHARAGQRLAIELWTTDAAPHLHGGVHTFISDELGIYEEVAAESRQTFSLTAPSQAGVYDFYCDTCCGGKAAPTMHGKLIVEA